MKQLILKIAVLLLRMVYAPMRLLPVKRRVVIISRQSRKASVDIRLLTDYLRMRYPDLKCKVLVRFIEPGIGGKLSYMPHMFVQMYYLATSRLVVLDGYCIGRAQKVRLPEHRLSERAQSRCRGDDADAQKL